MITFEEYTKQKKAEREAAKAKEAANRPHEGGIVEYINGLVEKKMRDSDYLQYLMMKASEQRTAERENELKQKAEADYKEALAAADQAYFDATHSQGVQGMNPETYKSYKAFLESMTEN